MKYFSNIFLKRELFICIIVINKFKGKNNKNYFINFKVEKKL